MKRESVCIGILAMAWLVPLNIAAQVESELTVREIMNTMITPTTATIWGAYQLQTDAEWQEIRRAALGVIAAGNLIAVGGAAASDQVLAEEADWQRHNQDMIAAARAVLEAVDNQNEEALSAVGNDLLYPPCESCHQQYQSQ